MSGMLARERADVTSRTAIATLCVIVAVAALLRGVWLTADPPVRRAVGIVWHDEGAWAHNARNKALWGEWRTDEWNPVFVAPVFTALEYASFASFGVGTWQARVVPALSGLAAVICLVAGLHALAGLRAALAGGALLAVNYAFVMWNRAALMESTMTMWIVAAWMAWTLSERRAWWAALAGSFAVAAWFTKAAAAFFVGALGLEVAIALVLAYRTSGNAARNEFRRAAWAGAGLLIAAAIAVVCFVVPYWSEYQFYNWQMSVTRKPVYTLRALMDRASWLPVVQGLFSGMWIELLSGLACAVAIAARWRTALRGERLLVLWVFVGLLELVVHDSGNERRYVMFIPALAALAALLLAGRTAPLPAGRHLTRLGRAALVAVMLPVSYLAAGSLLRPFTIDDILAGQLSGTVRLAACLALAATGVAVWLWPRLEARGGGRLVSPRITTALLVLALAWQVGQFMDWARSRTTLNHDASVALGRLLGEGTLVQGKLANGLALENRIRPLFVGNGFGNYDDRLRRDDARYILTYDLPRIGYESSDGSGLIQGMLEHHPRRRVIATFDVDETRQADRAALFDKFPDLPAHARD